MELSNLKPAEKSVRKRKRIGRGNATGQGRTAGKGHKGYKSRSGSGLRLHFEGGQMPLARRLPKRGFTNIFAKKVQVVNLKDLEKLNLKKIDTDILYDRRVINKQSIPVKILGNGSIKKAIEISAHSFSQSAIDKIEKVGGKVIYL
ncbi:50S ribosomal protein L15 [Candidatus Marinimicrobia bacterium]|jgi:large subunit ribosomal protein L15|nr:50S ribosomal protein L15 [Candidatus Neomarinimicrobiota bacterium]|tara:strand:- start:265 stop:702 length:438 start_codon:yes stop_codon:yes gene_type:complete